MKNLFIIPLLFFAQMAVAKNVDERVKTLEEKWTQYEAMKIEQNSRVAEAIAQLDKLRTDIQAVGGGTETQSVQMRQLQDSVERHYRDLEMRINAMESQLKVFQDELRRAIEKVAPQIAAEGKQFEKALAHVQNGEYAQAITSFDQFIKANSKSPHRSDALFWIAECRYAMRDYTQAIKDYQKFVESYPKSSKAPLAVLKQGDGFVNLQMKDEAKVFWKKLIQDYPRSDEAVQAQRKLDVLTKTGNVQASPPLQPRLPQPNISDKPQGGALPSPSKPAGEQY